MLSHGSQISDCSFLTIYYTGYLGSDLVSPILEKYLKMGTFMHLQNEFGYCIRQTFLTNLLPT